MKAIYCKGQLLAIVDIETGRVEVQMPGAIKEKK